MNLSSFKAMLASGAVMLLPIAAPAALAQVASDAPGATPSQATSVVAAAAISDPDAPSIAPIEPAALFDIDPLAESLLATVSGREDRPTWQTANAQGSATVRDNAVGDNSPTGALSVSDAAFQNVSGIAMVNLNTGNASSINASMSVNLSIHMAPAAVPGAR